MKCVIPCGGFGTRMQRIGLDKPKALHEVNGKPIIEHILDKVSGVDDVDEVFIVSNGFFLKDFNEWLEGFSFSKPVRLLSDGILRDEDKRGPVFTSRQALQWLKRAGLEDDLLIVYGDNLFDFDLNDFVKTFEKNDKDLVVVCDVGSLEEAKKFGVIGIDDDNVIKSVVEKPEKPESSLISTGVYLFRKESVPWFFMDYSPIKDLGFTHVIVRMFKQVPVMVYSIPNGCKWFDIGAPETYEKVKNDF